MTGSQGTIEQTSRLTLQPTLQPKPWGVLLAAGVAMALSLAGDLTLYAVLPAYAAGLGFELSTLGILLSANRLIRLVSNPLVGLLADRYNRRRLVLVGLGTGALSTLLYAVSGSFWIFLLGRLLWGISWSILYIGIYSLTLDITAPQDRGWSSGILQTFYFVGLAVNPVFGSFLSDQLGFPVAMVLCAAMQGIGLLAAFFFLPNIRSFDQTGSAERSGISGSLANTKGTGLIREKLSAVVELLVNTEIRSAFALYLVTLFIGDGIIMSTITTYLMQRYGDGVTVASSFIPVASAGGILISLRAVISAAGAPFSGKWADATGRHWMIIGFGCLLTITGCTFLAVSGAVWAVIIGIVLASFGSSMLMALLPVIVRNASGSQKSGLGIALLTTSGDLGCAAAPLIIYSLLRVIPLSQFYLISAGLFVWLGIMIIVWKRGSHPLR